MNRRHDKTITGLLLVAGVLTSSALSGPVQPVHASEAAPANRTITGAVPVRHLGLINGGQKRWRVFGHTPGTVYSSAHLNSTNPTENALAHIFVGGVNKHRNEPEGLHYAAAAGVESGDERQLVSVVDSSMSDPAPSLANAQSAFRPRVPDSGYAGPDASGVFSADVWARSSPAAGAWQKKAAGSTFFPASWTTADVLGVVDTAARTGKKITGGSPELWEAQVADPRNPAAPPITVRMAQVAGEIISAYPVQKQPAPILPSAASSGGLLTRWKVPSGSSQPNSDDLGHRDPAFSAIARVFTAGPVLQAGGAWATEGLSSGSFAEVVRLAASSADPRPTSAPGRTVAYRPVSGDHPGAWQDDATPYLASVWSRQPTDRQWLASSTPRAMFPDSWKRQDVVTKVNDAFRLGTATGGTREWMDPASGVTIVVAVDNGRIADAWPKLPAASP